MKDFLIVFTQIFVAVDIFGILPIFMSMSAEVDKPTRSKIVLDACLTALLASIAFLYLGGHIFHFLGITTDDFRIGGGILLFLISLSYLVFSNEEDRRVATREMAIVPIGIPLILGPAVLTTIVLLSQQYSHYLVLLSIVLNIFIVWVSFSYSSFILRFLGKGGTKALGKIAALFLLALSVMMIRIGVENFVKSFKYPLVPLTSFIDN